MKPRDDRNGRLRLTSASAGALLAGAFVGYVAWAACWRGRDRRAAPGTEPSAVREPPRATLEALPAAETPRSPAGGLRDRSDALWRVDEAAFRQIVEIALRPVAQPGDESLVPGMPPPPATAACEMALEGGGPVRVFDRFGQERRCRLSPADGGDSCELVFEATPARGGDGSLLVGDPASDDGPFEVYYPAAGGMLLAPGEAEGGIALSVYPARRHEVDGVTHPRAAADFVRRTEPLAPPKRRLQIDDCAIPFDRYDSYIAAYRGYIACRREGQYGLGVDADDRAFVVIDGRQALVGGRPDHLPDRPFPYRASTMLAAGLHSLVFYHVQGRGALRSRLAWQPPGAREMRVVPPSAFVSHRPARAVALERKDSEAAEVFFSAGVVRRLTVNREAPVTVVELAASGPKAAGDADDLCWVWRERGRVLGRGDRIELFVSGLSMPEAGVPPWRDVTLALEGPSGEVGRYARRLRAKARSPLEDEVLALQVAASSAPTFVYPHEPFEIHVRVVNDSTEPVELEAVEVRVERSSRRAAARGLGRFELPGVPEGARDVIARRMSRASTCFGPDECAALERVVYLAGPPGAPATSLSFEVVRSRAREVPDLSVKEGALVVRPPGARPAEAEGVLVPPRVVRALVVLPFDSEGELRKWEMIGSLAFARGGGKALLYGDALASPGAAGGEGLARRMEAALSDRGVSLAVRPLPPGAYPIHAACAGASTEFARPGWEAVWISLGHLDCRAGTPLRDFARGIDFLMDRASVLAPQARLVVVGPPPERTREKVSRGYADAAREVVERHRVAYVDLHSFVEALDIAALPGAAGREPGPDDGVRFPYPLGRAMELVAEHVLSR